MRRFAFLGLLLLALGATTGLAAKADAAAKITPPELISKGAAAPAWKNLQQLRALAAQGDPAACFALGTRLLEGDDELARDPAQARTLLETAAAGGVADAHFRLGKIYHDGQDVPRDYARTLEHYIAAARLGIPEAQHNLGAMFVSARGVKRDLVEGLAWLLVAEQSGAGSPAAQQVRERLAQRPADLRAAETRAQEIAADLPNATVRFGPAPLAAPPPVSAAAPVITSPAAPLPALVRPKMDPIGPIKLDVPTSAPPPAPR
ncbi:Localization factor PodJL [Lacunisphaera limnophila]|uniref:Localization factor PodJL n=1 Tax=Lacunisphaera limnophila TaxID=1838286 RepID=A0A1D8ASV5_9BACT|nr:tetratricopeptide repeat protein [Lacunisphaera limnophila]AOS43975.1 Localization factor PodJL [Lacunisphaera limnophila]